MTKSKKTYTTQEVLSFIMEYQRLDSALERFSDRDKSFSGIDLENAYRRYKLSVPYTVRKGLALEERVRRVRHFFS